jgi:hypothetical protein
MSRWRELAEKRRQAYAGQIRAAQPPAITDAEAGDARATNTAAPKMPELPKVDPTNVSGNSGNFGTGGDRTNRDPIVDFSSLWRWPVLDGPFPSTLPNPTDLLERSAILEADGLPRHDADALSLTESGYTSWEALATAWRDAIGRIVVSLPPQGTQRFSGGHLERLIAATGEFCGGSHFPSALANGRHLDELFGVSPVAPLVRLDHCGLIPLVALSVVPAQVLAIHHDAAELRCRSGAIQKFHRRIPEGAVVWWQVS